MGHDLAGEYGDDIRNLYLPYPSDAYLITAYAPSVERGVAAFTYLVDGIAAACPTTGFVFTGYSQGADIINGWAAGALSGRADASAAPLTDRVIAVALFGNPRRGADVAVGSGAMSDPKIREAVDALLAFLIDGSSDHLQYETEVDGIPSARTEAREFLIERIGPGR